MQGTKPKDMRKLKLQTQLSIDGFLAGTNREMDWMTWNWDDQLKEYVNNLTKGIGCIVMGKTFAPGFIPHWATKAANPNDPDYDFARIMTDVHKVVFSKSVPSGSKAPDEWNNTTLSTQSLTDGILELKQQEGGDIIAYGGSDFVSSLVQEDLIDEYHLFINPTAIGSGLPVFKQKTNLKLTNSKAFACGIVVLAYERTSKFFVVN